MNTVASYLPQPAQLSSFGTGISVTQRLFSLVGQLLNACSIELIVHSKQNHAVVWLPIPAAGVLSQIRACGIYCGQNSTGTGSLRVSPSPLLLLILVKNINLHYLCKRPWKPIGLWDFEAPTIDSQKTVRLSTLRAYRPPFTPKKISGTNFS
jgi:hypothetical protein